MPIGTVEQVEGKVGNAAKFTFTEQAAGFFNAGFAPNAAWNDAAGFSFWVKGDGSKNCGGLEFIDGDDYALRYGYCFPIELHRVGQDHRAVERPDARNWPARWSTPRRGFAPSKFRNVWFGKWFYWRSYPACSFTIEQMALEKKIDRDTADYTPKRRPACRECWPSSRRTSRSPSSPWATRSRTRGTGQTSKDLGQGAHQGTEGQGCGSKCR